MKPLYWDSVGVSITESSDRGVFTTGLETNWNYPLASRASDLENLLTLLNSTSPDFFLTPILLLRVAQ